MDGIRAATSVSGFIGNVFENLDNPGAIQAGVRGDGVKVGDRIWVYSGGPSCYVPGANAGFPLDVVRGIGSTTFSFINWNPLPLPAWVQPGVGIAAITGLGTQNGSSVFPT